MTTDEAPALYSSTRGSVGRGSTHIHYGRFSPSRLQPTHIHTPLSAPAARVCSGAAKKFVAESRGVGRGGWLSPARKRQPQDKAPLSRRERGGGGCEVLLQYGCVVRQHKRRQKK